MEAEPDALDGVQRFLLRTTLDLFDVVTWDYTIGDGRLSVSDNFDRLLGLPAADFPAFHGALMEAVQSGDHDATAGASGEWEFRDVYRLILPKGRVCWTYAAGRVLTDATGTLVRTIGIASDVTDRRLAEEARFEVESVLGTTFEPSAYVVVGLDETGTVQEWNEAAERLFGWTAAEVVGLDASRALVAAEARGTRAPWWQLPASPAGRVTIRLVRKDGTGFVGEVQSVVVGRGETFRLLIRDLTPWMTLEAHLRRRYLFDPVTHLAGRPLLVYRLRQAIARLRRRPSTLAVLAIDLDHFVAINEALGQESGDAILEMIGERLLREVRPTDTVARSYGDEFLIVVEEAGRPAGALRLARRIEEAVSKAIEVSGTELAVTASIGVTTTTSFDADAEALLREADAAMHRAKRAGRGHCVLFRAEVRNHALARIGAEQEIRRAVERSELTLHYQPIVEIASGRPVGAEALIRWRHPTRGLLTPAEFIPIAEETGEIVQIGAWALRTACAEAAGWPSIQGRPSLRVTVNLSASELADPQLVQRVRRAVQLSGLDPVRLTLEITETMVMEDPERTGRALQRVRDLGVRVAMDDFGTGYSSLANLRRFQVDELKIDRTFVAGVVDRADDATIVRLVIRVAEELRLSSIAEGVESREQREQLEWLGCTWGQGYFWAPPLSAAEFRTWLSLAGSAP